MRMMVAMMMMLRRRRIESILRIDDDKTKNEYVLNTLAILKKIFFKN